MKNNALDMANLIEGFRLSCQTEGKSLKTIDWYICFLNRFHRFVEQNQMLAGVGEIDKSNVTSS